MTRAAASLLAIAALAGCQRGEVAPRAATPPADWRAVATDHDRDRLRRWRTAWMEGLAAARTAGNAGELTRAGALFDPDRALAAALPPPGAYRCRVYKLGARGGTGSAFTAYPFFDCSIVAEGEVLSFFKLSGSQRPVGLIFRDSDARAIFLGTLVLGDETAPLQYGQDSARDMAGLVERVGDRRWRVVLPYPAFESLIDVVELVPAR